MTRSVWAWVRLLAGAGIIGLLVWRLGTDAFLDGLRVLDVPTLATAFAVGVLTTVLSAWRWCVVARGLGLRLSLGAAVADYYQALFVNAALPGGVLGDVDRAVRHGRDAGDVGRGVRAVVLERTAGQVVLLAVGAGVLLTVPSPVSAALRAHGGTVAVALPVAAGGAAAGYLLWRRLRRGGSRVAGAARTGVAEIRAGLLSRRAWPAVVTASAAVLAGHLATFVLAARAAGSTAGVLRLVPLLLLALLAMSLPLNVGGWGPREGVTAWAFGAAGLSATQGLTVAVVYGVFAFVAALPGAAVLAARLLRSRAARRVPAAPTPAAPVTATASPAPAVTVPAVTVPAVTVPAVTVRVAVASRSAAGVPVSGVPGWAARPVAGPGMVVGPAGRAVPAGPGAGRVRPAGPGAATAPRRPVLVPAAAR